MEGDPPTSVDFLQACEVGVSQGTAFEFMFKQMPLRGQSRDFPGGPVGTTPHPWGRGGGENWEVGTDTQTLLILCIR